MKVRHTHNEGTDELYPSEKVVVMMNGFKVVLAETYPEDGEPQQLAARVHLRKDASIWVGFAPSSAHGGVLIKADGSISM